MSITFNKFWRMTNVHGLILFGALAGFFLLMRALDLAHIFYLRSLNIVWVIIVVWSVIKAYRKMAGASYYEDFFDYFTMAFRTGLVGIGLFAAFLAIYLDQLDPAFMERLEELEDAGGVMSPVIAAFTIMLEGLASVIIVAFSIIQLQKSRTVEHPERKSGHLKKEARKHH